MDSPTLSTSAKAFGMASSAGGGGVLGLGFRDKVQATTAATASTYKALHSLEDKIGGNALNPKP